MEVRVRTYCKRKTYNYISFKESGRTSNMVGSIDKLDIEVETCEFIERVLDKGGQILSVNRFFYEDPHTDYIEIWFLRK